MKNIFTLSAILLFTAACGGGGSGGSGGEGPSSKPRFSENLYGAKPLNKEKALMDYKNFVAELKVGTVFKTQTTGEIYDIESEYNYETRERTYKGVVSKLHTINKTTILKIADGKFYTLETYQDLTDKFEDRKVVVTNKALPALEFLLKLPEAKIKDNFIYVDLDSNGHQKVGEDAELINNSLARFKIDALNLCNTSYEDKEFDAKFINQGKTTTLKDISSSSEMDCDEELSKSELAQLDLSSIEVCYENIKDGETYDEDQVCEENQNMNHLVK